MHSSSRIFVALDTDNIASIVAATAQSDCGYKFGLRQIHKYGTPAVEHVVAKKRRARDLPRRQAPRHSQHRG